MPSPLRIDLVRTNGIFSLDGEDFEVENNVWLVGNDDQVVVIDAAHDDAPIRDALGDRVLLLIVATHGHNDHINVAVELAGAHRRPGGTASRRRGPVGQHLSRSRVPTALWPMANWSRWASIG